jgi:lysozyme family protein
MPSTRDIAFEVTKELEGEWYDGGEDRDPNPTFHGVTQSTYERFFETKYREVGMPIPSVKFMTPEEEYHIYRWYWGDANCESLPHDAAIVVFDHAFNAGTRTARKLLQRTLGGLAVDGVIGPITFGRIQEIGAWTGERKKLFAYRLIVERLRDYRAIARASRLRPNLYSWVTRLVRMEEEIGPGMVA